MIRVHSVADIRAAEAALMARLPDGALMQRAATGLAAALSRMGAGYGARVVVLTGGGDNGGDALFAGARVARRGAQVLAVLARPDRTHAGGLAALLRAGGVVTDDASGVLRSADFVVDGLLGIGGQGGLRSNYAELAADAAESLATVVAVDLPSGIDPDTGETPGAHIRADVTVTFGARKIGLVIDPAAAAAGRIIDVDIGLGPFLPEPTMTVLENVDVSSLIPHPGRDTDKYRRGVVGVLAGSEEFSGAAVLCVGGAIRGGAGMVRYIGSAGEAVRSRWPEAVTASGRVQAWVAGPGLGPDKKNGRDLAKLIADGVPVLVDADGLRFLPRRFDTPALLTPHAGELARLLGTDRADVEARRLHHAVAAARKWNAVVLLKGSTTLVAAPDGRVRANPTGTPALATAGSGDVLAGLAGALLAGGLDPFDAGSVAAYVHGRAGHAAARARMNPSATDVLRALDADRTFG
ncbi:MAG TPA: NAD(P)H-hydrate dehydratase [Jiangellaceae bacterium]